MRRSTLSTIVFVMFVVLLMFSSCEAPDYQTVLTFDGAKYEIYRGTLRPNGDLSQTTSQGLIDYIDDNGVKQPESGSSVSIRTYEGDSANIFVYGDDWYWLDGLVFHKISDKLPNITDESCISSIEVCLPNSSDSFELSQQAKTDYIKFLVKITSDTKDISIQKIDGWSGTTGVVTYFKDYPACDISVFLKSLDDGSIGIGFAKTALNKKYFGDYDAVAIVPASLINEMKE